MAAVDRQPVLVPPAPRRMLMATPWVLAQRLPRQQHDLAQIWTGRLWIVSARNTKRAPRGV
jgi:hypothetical protein